MLTLNSGHTVCDVTCPFLVRAAGVKILFQQVLRHRQAVGTVTDRAELPGGFCPQSLTAQAGGNGFDVVFRQVVSKTRRAITLFCVTERLPDSGITKQTKLLSLVWLMAAQPPGTSHCGQPEAPGTWL